MFNGVWRTGHPQRLIPLRAAQDPQQCLAMLGIYFWAKHVLKTVSCSLGLWSLA